jgi:hypothetical protein
MKVDEFDQSFKLFMKGSDLRIHLQTDPRYQAFIPRAKRRIKMIAACLQDDRRGKIWAFSDETRRPSRHRKIFLTSGRS